MRALREPSDPPRTAAPGAPPRAERDGHHTRQSRELSHDVRSCHREALGETRHAERAGAEETDHDHRAALVRHGPRSIAREARPDRVCLGREPRSYAAELRRPTARSNAPSRYTGSIPVAQ